MNKQPTTNPLNIRTMEPIVLRVLRQRGIDSQLVASMTTMQVFEEYCGYYGLLKCGQEFAMVLDDARAKEAASKAAPEALHVFAKHCDQRGVKTMAKHLVQILDNIRSCEQIEAPSLKHAA